MHDVVFRDATAGDSDAIAALYNVHVLGTPVTFELEAVDATEMARRIADVQARGLPWLVAHAGDGALLGYAYAGPWKARAGYAETVESSIYLDGTACGQGLGTRLYGALIDALQACGVRCVIAGAALPNPASEALHQRLGFKPVGVFRAVGVKFGRALDVAYWQLHLDRPPAV